MRFTKSLVKQQINVNNGKRLSRHSKKTLFYNYLNKMKKERWSALSFGSLFMSILSYDIKCCWIRLFARTAGVQPSLFELLFNESFREIKRPKYCARREKFLCKSDLKGWRSLYTFPLNSLKVRNDSWICWLHYLSYEHYGSKEIFNLFNNSFPGRKKY